MVEYAVRMRAEVLLSAQSDETVDRIAERIRESMDPLVKSAEAVKASDGIFDFSMHVSAVSPLDAVLEGATVLRTAAHHAQVYTGEWPALEDWRGHLQQRAVEAVELVDADERSDTHVGRYLPAY